MRQCPRKAYSRQFLPPATDRCNFTPVESFCAPPAIEPLRKLWKAMLDNR